MKVFFFSLAIVAVAIAIYNSSLLFSFLEQTPVLNYLTWQGHTQHQPSSSTFFALRFTSPAFFAPAQPANMSVPRAVRQVFLAIEQSEGVGARVRRSIGTPKLRNFSPFLMLDHFTSSPGAGFPDHPHRGQETITYILQGAVDHEDFAGNAGTIEEGDLQFMTAGRGIMHAEMPRQNSDGTANVGMQLWVDLPEKLKTCEPRYRDLRAKEIPKIEVDDGRATIKIISGQSHDTESVQELAYTPVWLFDVKIKPGGKVTQELPVGWNAFAYTLSGTSLFGTTGKDQQTVEKFHNVVFEQKGDAVVVEVDPSAEEDGRFSESQPPFSMSRKYSPISSPRCRSPIRSKGGSIRAVRPQFPRTSLSGNA